MGFLNWLGVGEKRYKCRGIKIFLVIEPLIVQDEKPIINLLYDSLPNYFADTTITVNNKDIESNTTTLKVFAPKAKFSLPVKDLIPFYSESVRNYIKFVIFNLNPNNYQLKGFQFELVYRISPPEKEGEFFPMPPDNEWIPFLPTLEQIKREITDN
jgi:hypothetical protein